MSLLITGGCGFLGSNLAAAAMARGIEPILFDDLSRVGADANLAWLETLGRPRFVRGSITDGDTVADLVRQTRPTMVFHLAGQVAMTTSLEDPRRDFTVNALGTVHLLDALRRFAPEAGFVYSSTNKVYGDLEQYRYEATSTRWRCLDFPDGFPEDVPLQFQSPYGCSKGAADQYVLDYARVFGMKTTVFRHSSMYGGRQFATSDQGWIGWFVAEALRVQAHGGTIRIAGDGRQVRDVLHADDMVALYFSAAERIDRIAGEAFNIGGGMPRSLSLLELFSHLEQLVGSSLPLESGPPRISDQRVFVADIGKARRLLDWHPAVDTAAGLARMLHWVKNRQMP